MRAALARHGAELDTCWGALTAWAPRTRPRGVEPGGERGRFGFGFGGRGEGDLGGLLLAVFRFGGRGACGGEGSTLSFWVD